MDQPAQYEGNSEIQGGEARQSKNTSVTSTAKLGMMGVVTISPSLWVGGRCKSPVR